MTAFHEGNYDVLLSTGHRRIRPRRAERQYADRASRRHVRAQLALYQLRGRVGRSKRRAYAYFTTPASARSIGEGAEKAAQSAAVARHARRGLLAAPTRSRHPRRFGNLLGEEHSGHIREVGFRALSVHAERAVSGHEGGRSPAKARTAGAPRCAFAPACRCSFRRPGRRRPSASRLGLYWRLSALETCAPTSMPSPPSWWIASASSPPEVDHLLPSSWRSKVSRRAAGIAKVDAGLKGAVIMFHKNEFANTQGLAAFMQSSRGMVKLQPDHKLIFRLTGICPSFASKACAASSPSSPTSPPKAEGRVVKGDAARAASPFITREARKIVSDPPSDVVVQGRVAPDRAKAIGG